MPSLLARLKSYFNPSTPSPKPTSPPSPSPPQPPTNPIVLTPSQILSQPPESFPTPTHGLVTWRTLLSSPQTATSGLISGIATCAPKTGHLCPHRHTQPEMYYIISGKGLMLVDGKEWEVESGGVVYVPGDAEHGIRNVDEGEELVWLYVFPGDGFGEVGYRFRGEDY